MKRIHIILCVVLIIALPSSCTVKDLPQDSQYESQLYGSLKSFFDYYYSMDIWDLKQITDKLYSLDTYTEEDRFYLIGKIDSTLEYSPLYGHLVYSGQKYLKKKIISDDLNNTLKNFYDAKDSYLKTIKADLETQEPYITEADFKQQCAELSSVLEDINIDVKGLDSEDKMTEYINQIKKAVGYMTK